MKYKFKNKEDYTNQRNAVYTEAEQALANGDVDRANELMADMEEMDADYEAYATAQANLNAARNGAQTAGLTGLGVQNPGGTVVETLGAAAGERDMLNTVEYQTAFMNLICRNEPIPAEYRDAIRGKLVNAATTVTGTTAVIPTTTWREIVRELKGYGELYARFRHTNVQGGLEIPVVALTPEATWVADGAASNDQEVKADDAISFKYHGLECKIAQTLIANVVDLKEFNELFVPMCVEAIVAAIERDAIRGDGNGKMLGVINDERIPAANIIEMTEEDMNWAGWHKKVFAKMKKRYRKGAFIMAQGTYDANIEGMVDQSGQPAARANYGLNGEENYRFRGKEVITTEEDVLPAFDSAADGEVFAVFMRPEDYVVNSNLQMRVDKWTDHDANKEKTKVTIICDGKAADVNGILIIKKKA